MAKPRPNERGSVADGEPISPPVLCLRGTPSRCATAPDEETVSLPVIPQPMQGIDSLFALHRSRQQTAWLAGGDMLRR